VIGRADRIAAARRFAPPLVMAGQVDKRGARLHYVNCKAVAYTAHAGLRLEDVYPGAMRALRHLAPPQGSLEAPLFAREAGVSVDELYPSRVSFGGEGAGAGWRWKWAVVGALIGACLVGPVGAATLGVAGGLIGGSR
jgi:hypothetical protein